MKNLSSTKIRVQKAHNLPFGHFDLCIYTGLHIIYFYMYLNGTVFSFFQLWLAIDNDARKINKSNKSFFGLYTDS